MLKKCSKCKEEKSYDEFYKNKTRKDGYHHQCKSCGKELRLNNKEYHKEYDKKHYENNKERKKEYRSKNKDKKREYDKKYRKENKEYINKYGKQYYEKNKEKINEYDRKYRKNKKQTSPLYKLKCCISTSICKSMKNRGYTKRSKTFEILGCSYEEFKLHIEKQFKDGMSWENRGLKGWHLDHIYPVSLAKDEEELIKLNHYTNFQPLWAEDNLKKGNKII